MASDNPAESKTTHPTLGPAVAIQEDTRRTKLRLVFLIFTIPLGLVGILLGRGDMSSGQSLLGLAEIAGSIVLILYGVRGSITDVQHLANPTRLVIARDGFELFPGNRPTSWWETFPSRHPISWDEVATIGDRRHPNSPSDLRIQVDDPQAFASRRALGPLARLMLGFNKGDLILGSGMAVPIEKVEVLMRRQMAESRHTDAARVAAPTGGRPPKGRRSARRR